MPYMIKTINGKKKIGWDSRSYYETMAEVENRLLWFEKEKTMCVATDEKGNIVGRVIEEDDNQFKMWIEVY